MLMTTVTLLGIPKTARARNLVQTKSNMQMLSVWSLDTVPLTSAIGLNIFKTLESISALVTSNTMNCPEKIKVDKLIKLLKNEI